jgi:hypothetical protein
MAKLFLNCTSPTINKSLFMIYLEHSFIGIVKWSVFTDHNLLHERLVICGGGLFLVQTFLHFWVFSVRDSFVQVWKLDFLLQYLISFADVRNLDIS